MEQRYLAKWMLALTAVSAALLGESFALAQTQRYMPSTPTVSPYLNLFQNRNGRPFNNALPNYFTFVRPMQRQQQINQYQQQVIQNQGQMIGQLQGNLQQMQQQANQPVVSGHGSWFANPGQRSQFLNTSRFYSRTGTTTTSAR